MAKLFNRARMTTATTGTGTITLGSAVSKYQTFASAGVPNADVVSYAIEDGTAWETGRGTYTSAGTTLTRGLLQSSTGSLISLNGTAEVFIAGLAEDIVTIPQCGRLTYTNTTTLTFSPHNGDQIKINGTIYQIPSAGVTITVPSQTVTMTIASPAVATWTAHGLVSGSAINFATSSALPTGVTAGTIYYVIATGLAADTFQFSAAIGGSAVNTSGSQSGTHKIGTRRLIYAYNNAGTLTLETSTTTRATSTTAGNVGTEIKSGDDTRSLVGMAFDINASTVTAWSNVAAKRLVISWFNRRLLSGVNTLTAQRSATSSSLTEINSEIRCEFVTWSTEDVFASLNTTVFNSVAGDIAAGVSFNGATTEHIKGEASIITSMASSNIPFGCSGVKTGLSEGYNYATLFGSTNAGTATFLGLASNYAAFQTAVYVGIRG